MTASRLLVLASHVPADGGLGGMIRYTVEVTRSLLARDDVEVHVHCRPEAAAFFVDDLGVAPDRLVPHATGSTIRDSIVEVLSVGRQARDLGIEVIFGSKQIVPRRSYGAIRVLTVHDMLPFDRPTDFGLLKRALLPLVYRHSLLRAEVLACVSTASRRQLAAHVAEAAERAIVVPNAMTSILQSVGPEPVPTLEARRFALAVGDQSPRKNVGFLLRIWPRVVARVPDAHLALVGPPGWGRNEALPGLEQLVAAGAVSHLGRLSDAALRWAYEHARLTLCPSLLEGFGLPVLEALSLGSPAVISTDPAQVEAAQGAALPIPVTDSDRWVDAIVEHIQSPRCALIRYQTRTWDDVAADLVGAVAAAVGVGSDQPTGGLR